MDPDPLYPIDTSLINTGSFPELFYIFLLLVINGAFVAAEYALISCDPSDVKEDAKNSNKLSAKWLLDHSELAVASIQLGITICSLLIGWLAIDFFKALIIPIEEPLLLNFGPFAFYFIPLISAIFVVTLVHVVCGELVVKAIGTAYPALTLSVLAAPVRLFTIISYPLSKTVYLIANMFLKPLQLTIGQSSPETLSIAEIKKLFSSVPTSSDLGSEQAQMIRGVVGFSETVAREIMTPRTDLVTVKATDSLEEVLKVILESEFSRIPVRGERVDDILGILLSRDVLSYLLPDSKRFEVKKVMRKCYFIPGTKPIDDLLSEFKRRKQHMAIILDEHGGLDGVVTLEDILEEIVGNIYDENDELDREIVVMEDGKVLVEGGLLVADVNEKLNYNIPEGEYDTIAGFLFTFLGRIPKITDELFLHEKGLIFVNRKLSDRTPSEDEVLDNLLNEEGLLINIESVQGHRIESVKFTRILNNSNSRPIETESISQIKASEVKSQEKSRANIK